MDILEVRVVLIQKTVVTTHGTSAINNEADRIEEGEDNEPKFSKFVFLN